MLSMSVLVLTRDDIFVCLFSFYLINKFPLQFFSCQHTPSHAHIKGILSGFYIP